MQEMQGFPTIPGYYILRSPLSYCIEYVEVNFLETNDHKEFFFRYINSSIQYFFSDYKVYNDFVYYYWTGPIKIADDLKNMINLINKCPACYESNVIKINKLHLMTLLGDDEKICYHCQCSKCYFASSMKSTERDAVEEWNSLYSKLTVKD